MGLSVYVHLPYCRQRCHYCDFNAHAASVVPEDRYTDALLREIDHAGRSDDWTRGRDVETVFFGGGTPSLFSPSSIERILGAIDARFRFEDGVEITLEANPGTLEGGGYDKLSGFRAAGINRLSIGAQSFQEELLRWLGRIHTVGETEDAVRAARRAGFENLSCDLIFAVPGQSAAMWEADLDRLIALGPDHVSAYNLTFEPGTVLTRRRDRGSVEPSGEDEELGMFDTARERLGAAGFEHYEISNYARPGRRSRHNVGYWTWRDYLGLGAGAHGFRRGHYGDGSASETSSTVAADWGRRYANVELPESYMAAGNDDRLSTTETLERDGAVAEYVMMGMRMLDGIDDRDFRRTFGTDLGSTVHGLAELTAGGLIRRAHDRTRLTERGLVLADSVIARMTTT